MALFTVLTEPSQIVDTWMSQTKERLKDDNWIMNPFKGGIRPFDYLEEIPSIKAGYIIYIEPIWYNFAKWGWVIALGVLVIWGWTWYVWPGVVLGCLGFFWSKYFYFGVALLGLKKAGYKGKVQMLNNDTVIRKLLIEGA
jgi:hypothetical protein